MEYDPDNYLKPITEHHGKKLMDVDRHMTSAVELLQELSRRVNELPKDKEANAMDSELAAGLYDRLEKIKKDVSDKLKDLKHCKTLLNKEKDRCRSNLEKITSDASKLHTAEAKEKYSFAKLSQEFEYKKAITQLKELVDVTSWAERALGLARARKYPGAKSKKRHGRFPIPPPGVRAPWEIQSSHMMPAIDFQGSKAPAGGSPLQLSPSKEISNLMSIGPIGVGFSK